MQCNVFLMCASMLNVCLLGLSPNTRYGFPWSDRSRLQAICDQWGWKFSWMDEERTRMEAEEKSKMGQTAWKSHLKAMESKRDLSADIPPGICKSGCGRPIAPGLSKEQQPYTTCCRGCATGFGHFLVSSRRPPVPNKWANKRLVPRD